MADFILGTQTCGIVQQTASHSCQGHFATVLVFQLVQAAFTAPVTERFPLFLVHLGQGLLFPEPLSKPISFDRVSHVLANISRARAQSARMAQTAVARGVDLEMTRDLVHHQVQRQPYSGFFAVEEHDVSFQKFDGTYSPVVTRAVFVSSDAAIVLPYDPVTDRVLLVEQFRAGPYIRGDRYPWCLEPIAGLIDAGETPAQAALREAKEEAGLDLKGLFDTCYAIQSLNDCNIFLFMF